MTKYSIKLEGVSLGILQRVAKTKVTGKKQKKWTDDVKGFVLTLQFYSCKAYEFVRKAFDLVLPHPRTIRRWYSKIPCEPGFTEPAFIALQKKAVKDKEKGKKSLVNLMFDEVSIRKQAIWDGTRFRGYVDIGDLTEESESSPFATHALVFMVVSVDEYHKVPIGYFFIDGMNGPERANLVQVCLKKLHDAGESVGFMKVKCFPFFRCYSSFSHL